MNNLKIEYSKNAVKYVLYKVIVKFIPEIIPESDEIEAILEGKKDRTKNGTIPHDAINWD